MCTKSDPLRFPCQEMQATPGTLLKWQGKVSCASTEYLGVGTWGRHYTLLTGRSPEYLRLYRHKYLAKRDRCARKKNNSSFVYSDFILRVNVAGDESVRIEDILIISVDNTGVKDGSGGEFR